MSLSLDPARTVVVLIDLQMGILSMPLRPHSAETATANGVALARAVAEGGGLAVRVNVAFAPDLSDRPQGRVDAPPPASPGGLPADYSTFHPDVAALDAVTVTKRQWGAFHGTALDDLLRRRRIDTVVVTGVATNFGVEQTVREAWQLGYSAVVAEDGCSTIDQAMHAFAVEKIFPRIARVQSTRDIVTALGAAA
jgi:nicotinamidase-related amidase